MKRLGNTEAELKKALFIKKSVHTLCRIHKLFIRQSRCFSEDLNRIGNFYQT